MMTNQQEPESEKYPLIEGLLRAKNIPLQGTYTYRDAARIFSCSVRALQDRIRRGELRKRNLPGRARFLSADLEEFLQNSIEKKHFLQSTNSPERLGPLPPARTSIERRSKK